MGQIIQGHPSLIRLRHMHARVYYGTYLYGRLPASTDFINSMTSNSIMVTNQSCEESLQLHISETEPNSTAASFHSCSSIITHVQSRCQWILVDESSSDGPETNEDSQIEEREGAEDIPVNDDDSAIHNRTYQFNNCQVYINSFNARGVKVKNSGNYAPRVTRLSCSLLH